MDQGLTLFGEGQYEEAAQHFWRFSQANPDDATPHLYLARIHRRTGNTELAAEAIRQAELLAPEDAAVHRELGFLLLDRGQPNVAVDRFRHAVELDEQSSEGWVGLVRALREAGRGAEATAAIGAAPAEVRALLSPPDPI
jgi:Flp pilus assembly protein TadD